MVPDLHLSLLRRHNARDGVSNHQPHDCLLNRLFRRRSKKTSKLRVTGLCVRNSPVIGEFPTQMASNAENISIWWRHHGAAVTALICTGCQHCISYLIHSNRERTSIYCIVFPYVYFSVSLLKLLISPRGPEIQRNIFPLKILEWTDKRFIVQNKVRVCNTHKWRIWNGLIIISRVWSKIRKRLAPETSEANSYHIKKLYNPYWFNALRCASINRSIISLINGYRLFGEPLPKPNMGHYHQWDSN